VTRSVEIYPMNMYDPRESI